MKRFLKYFGIAALSGLLALIFAAWLLPFRQPLGTRARNLWCALQLGSGVKRYAAENDGRFPMQLSELFPDYVDAARWNGLLYDTRKGAKDPPLPNSDWLYFGAFFDEEHPPPILIAAPQSFTHLGRSERIIVCGDISGEFVSEEEYQTELRKTIEAMHKRFDGTQPAP